MACALRAGARGYLLKDCSRQQLVDAVRAAARGEALLAPEMLQRLLAAPAKVDRPGPTKTNLSERELEVLGAVARGLRSKEIADRLNISERTVKAHLAGIFNKLGVDSRAAAVSAAMEKGWLRVTQGEDKS